MSVKDDGMAIISEIHKVVQETLNTEVAETVREEISKSVYKNVYALYSPSLYTRREKNGGLADPKKYNQHLYKSGMQLNVSDTRRPVKIVESGVGYTWRNSRIYQMTPFPRPYFEEAENESVVLAESIIQKAVSML